MCPFPIIVMKPPGMYMLLQYTLTGKTSTLMYMNDIKK